MAPRPFTPFAPLSYPESPGCFLVRDRDGALIFVGKSTNLRRRLAQMVEDEPVQPGSQRPHRRYLELATELLARADSVEVILLHNDAECTFLINALIERFRPLFNLATFLEPLPGSYIVQIDEPFPRLIPSSKKRVEKTGKILSTTVLASTAPSTAVPAPKAVFGPFPGGPVRDLILKMVTEKHGLRTCDPLPKKACVLYELKVCSAPCEGRISTQEYQSRIEETARILSAPAADLVEALEAQVADASARLEFERAKRLNEQLKQVIKGYKNLAPLTHTGQSPVAGAVLAAAAAVVTGSGLAVIACSRAGRLYSVEMHPCEEETAEFLEAFFAGDCPDEIITPAFSGSQETAEHLAEISGHAVKITFPASGEENTLFDIARINHDWQLRRR